jgi:hypothetical protein
MKPESQLSKSASAAQPEDVAQWDPYLIAIVNDCQDAASGRRSATISENISVVVDELDSTALRRRTALLKPVGGS